MSDSTNFKQWDPAGANMETDGAYNADSQRAGGATSGAIFTSPLGNKVLFQQSTMVKALAEMLYGKGFTSIVDGSAAPGTSVSALQALLANLLTTADKVPQIVANFSTGNELIGVSGFENNPRLIYTTPNNGLTGYYRISWRIRQVGVIGGTLTMGPFKAFWTSASVAVNTIVPAFNKTGGIVTTISSNTVGDTLEGVPFIFSAQANTGISASMNGAWNAINPQGGFEYTVVLEQLYFI